jgi:hypothetical protein
MEQIKEIISKRKYDNIPCFRCGEDQGYFQLVEGVNKFYCSFCGAECNAKNYSDLRKEYHLKHQDDLEVVEVDLDKV